MRRDPETRPPERPSPRPEPTGLGVPLLVVVASAQRLCGAMALERVQAFIDGLRPSRAGGDREPADGPGSPGDPEGPPPAGRLLHPPAIPYAP
jgi:hypothetical protein